MYTIFLNARDIKRVSREVRSQNRPITGSGLALLVLLFGSWTSAGPANDLLPIPDHLVVLTFDDGTKSDIAYVAPLLKQYGFGASFYVTEGLRDIKRDDDNLSWEDIRQLDKLGFEIGNHTETHPDLMKLTKAQILTEIEGIEQHFKQNGIPAPRTFAYPLYHDSVPAAEVLLQKGYMFARRGVTPEFPDGDNGAQGPAYDPAKHYPLLIPATGYAGPKWGFRDLAWAVDQAKSGKIAVLNFHGVPYPRAPWVSVEPKVFAEYMNYLRDQKCTVIAMRDLAKYVEPAALTKIPLRRERGRFASGTTYGVDSSGKVH
jgi:peptidoglycan/xylan/chitin deacetylase (PgdA/CDA1 family)